MSRSSITVSAALGTPIEAEPGRELALVHHAFADEIGVLGVMHDEGVEIAGIDERAAHHLGVGDALRPVGEGDGAGGLRAGRSRSSPAPLMPLVSAAIGWTWTIAVSRARRSTKSTMAGSSIAGLVSGCDTMVVTPPAAAAWLAEAKVSRYSAPGSPTKARMSMRPGATTLPRQSTISVPSGTPAAPMPRLASRIDAVGDQEVAVDIEVARGIDDPRIGEQDRAAVGEHVVTPARAAPGHTFGRLRDSASSTAMRTATPISTCSRISDWAPSATLESISTPRFIGPGCITSASGLA